MPSVTNVASVATGTLSVKLPEWSFEFEKLCHSNAQSQGYLPDIRPIKRAIEGHIDNIAFPDDAARDEYIYNLIHKLVGDYISEDMIMRLSI